MKKTLLMFLLIMMFLIIACAPKAAITPEPLPATDPALMIVLPSQESGDLKSYQNDSFGIEFQYPSTWLGPEEYISEQNLRIEIGSDKVYPYGTGIEEQIYELKNSYYVRLEYFKNYQDQYWRDAFQSIVNMQDGESLSAGRSVTIKVKQLNIGKFQGVEYISASSETAQMGHFYSRIMILFDEQSNFLIITAAPNNVEVSSGTDWRVAFQQVEQANILNLYNIVDSLKFK